MQHPGAGRSRRGLRSLPLHVVVPWLCGCAEQKRGAHMTGRRTVIWRHEIATRHALQTPGSLIRDHRTTANRKMAGMEDSNWLGLDLSDAGSHGCHKSRCGAQALRDSRDNGLEDRRQILPAAAQVLKTTTAVVKGVSMQRCQNPAAKPLPRLRRQENSKFVGLVC